MKLRSNLAQALNVLMVLSSAFMFWKTLAVVANSPSPIVVVLSGSMEPAFQRGDILFLWNRDSEVSIGDIVVYNLKGKDIPIVHRVVRNHIVGEKDGKVAKIKAGKSPKLAHSPHQLLLTKGDNNPTDDLPLYSYNQQYLDRDLDLQGSVKGYVPLVGYVTILITENVYFKYALMGLLAASSLFSNE